MALQNQWLCGQPEAVLAYLNGSGSETLQHHDFSGISDLDVAILYAISGNETFSFDQHELLPVEGGCAVETLFPLPEKFITQIAQSDEAKRQQLAQDWADEDEITLSPKALHNIIEALHRLAHTRTEGQMLYFHINW